MQAGPRSNAPSCLMFLVNRHSTFLDCLPPASVHVLTHTQLAIDFNCTHQTLSFTILLFTTTSSTLRKIGNQRHSAQIHAPQTTPLCTTSQPCTPKCSPRSLLSLSLASVPSLPTLLRCVRCDRNHHIHLTDARRLRKLPSKASTTWCSTLRGSSTLPKMASLVLTLVSHLCFIVLATSADLSFSQRHCHRLRPAFQRTAHQHGQQPPLLFPGREGTCCRDLCYCQRLCCQG